MEKNRTASAKKRPMAAPSASLALNAWYPYVLYKNQLPRIRYLAAFRWAVCFWISR